MTLCHKLWFSNPYIFGFQHRKALTFQTMTFVRSNNISLKYQGLRHWVPKILRLENQSLWQTLNAYDALIAVRKIITRGAMMCKVGPVLLHKIDLLCLSSSVWYIWVRKWMLNAYYIRTPVSPWFILLLNLFGGIK